METERVKKGEASWEREVEGDRTIEENWLFALRQERYRSRTSGRAHDFYVIRLADSVNVIALTPDRRVLMVEQFRAGSGRDSLETPGGLIDPGEDPLEAGARELREETGYVGDPPRLLGVVWSNPSILTSRSWTVLITNAVRVADPRPDEGEEVRLELVPAREDSGSDPDGQGGTRAGGPGAALVDGVGAAGLAAGDGGNAVGEQAGQLHLAKLMGLVAAFGALFGLMRALGGVNWASGLPLLFLLALPPSWLLVSRWIDPRSEAVLLRNWEMLPRRLIQRLMTFVGVALSVFLVYVFGYSIVVRMF